MLPSILICWRKDNHYDAHFVSRQNGKRAAMDLNCIRRNGEVELTVALLDGVLVSRIGRQIKSPLDKFKSLRTTRKGGASLSDHTLKLGVPRRRRRSKGC